MLNSGVKEYGLEFWKAFENFLALAVAFAFSDGPLPFGDIVAIFIAGAGLIASIWVLWKYAIKLDSDETEKRLKEKVKEKEEELNKDDDDNVLSKMVKKSIFPQKIITPMEILVRTLASEIQIAVKIYLIKMAIGLLVDTTTKMVMRGKILILPIMAIPNIMMFLTLTNGITVFQEIPQDNERIIK